MSKNVLALRKGKFNNEEERILYYCDFYTVDYV